ncbi:hypothetical protein B0H14DRAFT_3432798 [Mycena olivaceomarginata]|nr:hypothetical protein B0H14DRAFT_3432798 [Mycena olivaceomarginata]
MKNPLSLRAGPPPDDCDDMVVDDVLPNTKSGGRSRKPRGSGSSAGSSKSSKAVQADFSPRMSI